MRKTTDKANLYEVQLEAHKIPVNIERPRDGYVTYGEDNLYPNYLIELYNRSAKHNAIVNSKITYVYGQGLQVNVQDARVQALYESVNRWQSLNEFAYQLITDLELYNGCAIECIWNRAGTSYEMKVLEFKNVRSNVDGSMFYYSPQWAQYNTNDIIEYPAFDVTKRKGSQIFYYKVYRPGCKVYPIPNYIGCIPYIETDIEISNYHLNNIKNGFWGGKVITFIAQQPTAEEMRAISKQFKYTKAGTDNAGKFVLNFVPNKDAAPIIESLEPDDSDTKFEILNKTVLQEIFVGHQITSPMLMGVRVEGQLGGRTEMLDAYELFKNTYVNGRQQIAEKIINFHAENITGTANAYSIIPTEPITPAQQEVQAKEMQGEKQQAEVNDALRNLTGRQLQNVMRIINKYGKGVLTYEQAVTMLKGGYGLKEEEIDMMLGESINEFSIDSQDYEYHLSIAATFGVSEDLVYTLSTNTMHFNTIEEAEEVAMASQDIIENKILRLLDDNPELDNKNIATTVRENQARVEKIINELIKTKRLSSSDKTGQLIRKPTKAGKDSITKQVKIPEIKVMYKYTLATPAVPLLKGGQSREFCQRMMKLKRIYSYQDIKDMSSIFGYDVWSYRGGWYRNPYTDETTPYCRHVWSQVKVIQK